MMRQGNTTKSFTPASAMKKLWALVCLGVVWVIVPQARAQDPGDVGSAGCREVQLEAQSAVTSGGPYKNHGQVVKTAAQVVSPAEETGEITEACAACIMEQFAQRIPIAQQEACGEVTPVCDFGGTGGCCSHETCIANDVCLNPSGSGVCFGSACDPSAVIIPCP